MISAVLYGLKRHLRRYAVVLGAFIVLIFAIISPFLLQKAYHVSEREELAQLGDWLGGTSAPLIGFAGFLMVLAAFMLQREELHLTRDEFKEQNSTLRMQRFENTFFNLLRFHHDILENLGKADESSRQFFGRVYGMLENQQHYDINERMKRGTHKALDVDTLFIEVTYPEVFREQQADLGHYFRNLYHILRFVHTSKVIDNNEKQFYARLVRAQLSAHELVFIFYNCLPPSEGFPKLKFLVDRYDMLQNLDTRLLRGQTHVDIYRATHVTDDPFIVAQSATLDIETGTA